MGRRSGMQTSQDGWRRIWLRDAFNSFSFIANVDIWLWKKPRGCVSVLTLLALPEHSKYSPLLLSFRFKFDNKDSHKEKMLKMILPWINYSSNQLRHIQGDRDSFEFKNCEYYTAYNSFLFTPILSRVPSTAINHETFNEALAPYSLGFLFLLKWTNNRKRTCAIDFAPLMGMFS